MQPAKFVVRYAPPAGSRDTVRMLVTLRTHHAAVRQVHLCCAAWQEVFIDPFEGGRFLTRSELQDILLHIVPDPTNPEYLRAIRNRDVWYVGAFHAPAAAPFDLQ